MQDELARQLAADGVAGRCRVPARGRSALCRAGLRAARAVSRRGRVNRAVARRGVRALRRAASGRVRPCLSRQPDRDRQHPGDRDRPHAKDRAAAPAGGRQPRCGAGQDRALRLPESARRAGDGADAVLPARCAAAGRADRRAGDRPANQLDDGRAAGRTVRADRERQSDPAAGGASCDGRSRSTASPRASSRARSKTSRSRWATS